jgi:hypothetical protein
MWASHGETADAGAQMSIMRVATPSASSSSSSPGSHALASSCVAPHLKFWGRSTRA